MKKQDLAIAIIAHKQNVKPNLPSSAYNWNGIQEVKTKNGEKQQFFDSPTATLENLEIHVSILNPDEIAHPTHQHPEEELMIIKEGTVEALINGKLVTAGAGSFVFQAANTKNVGMVPATYMLLSGNRLKQNY